MGSPRPTSAGRRPPLHSLPGQRVATPSRPLATPRPLRPPDSVTPPTWR